MKYEVIFKVPPHQDLTGWEIQFPSGDGFGEGGFGSTMLYHDIFEHWFEESDLFRTRHLSINGEAVAMGIRHSLESNWGLCSQFGGYNLLRGWMWNSVATIMGLLYESNEEGVYQVDPNPYRNPLVEVEDYTLEEAMAVLNPIKDEYPEEYPTLSRDYAFGMAWAEEVYGWEQQKAASVFMENMKLFNRIMEIGEDPYEDNTHNLSTMNVRVDLGKADIRATIRTESGRVGYISSNMDETKVKGNCSRLLGRPCYYE